jgi:hypothetical protein
MENLHTDMACRIQVYHMEARHIPVGCLVVLGQDHHRRHLYDEEMESKATLG